LNIELDVVGMNGDRGSEIEIEGGEKRSSDAAAMRTMGWRQRVPEVEGSFSRREIVCMAREIRKSDGGWDVGIGRKDEIWLPEEEEAKVLSVKGTRLTRIEGKIR
jgi:hypothetical protein